MRKIIKIRCLEEFKLYNNSETELIADVKVGKYNANLDEETEEYFSLDSENREFLVGQLDIDGNIVMVNGFELIRD